MTKVIFKDDSNDDLIMICEEFSRESEKYDICAYKNDIEIFRMRCKEDIGDFLEIKDIWSGLIQYFGRDCMSLFG